MRTFVKMILPVAAFMLAGAGAVGTHLSQRSTEGSATMTGYIHNPSSTNCLPVNVDCQIESSGVLCKFGTPEKQVYRFSEADKCELTLWKTPEN